MNFTVWLLASSLLCLGCLSPARGGEVFKIDPATSTIAFRVKHFLGTAKGKFSQFGGTVYFDRDHPEKSSVEAMIQARSIDTAIAKRDEHLRSAEFFNVAKYPEITFKSRNANQTGAESGDITGDLMMHGIKETVTLHVQLVQMKGAGGDQTSQWHVTTEPIKRSQFGLVFNKTLENVSMIGDDVSVTMDIEARKAR